MNSRRKFFKNSGMLATGLGLSHIFAEESTAAPLSQQENAANDEVNLEVKEDRLGYLGTRRVIQLCLVVKNVEETAKKYCEFFGWEMPRISIIRTDEPEKYPVEYRGNPCLCTAKSVYFWLADNVGFEILEPDETPSVWREWLDEHGEGFHHVAFSVKGTHELHKRLAEKGIGYIQRGEMRDGRYSYLDTFGDLKLIVETLEFSNPNNIHISNRPPE